VRKKLKNGEPIYALIDGNHRLAALLRLALSPEYPAFTIDDNINLVPHVADAPLPLCRAVSALLNESHYMGRTASFIDSLYYMYDTVQHLKKAKVKVNSQKRLTDELRAAGVTIINKASKDEHGRPMTGITDHHLRMYWEWLVLLDEEGMDRLVELQGLDAAGVHEHVVHRLTPHPHGDVLPNPKLSDAHSQPRMPDEKSLWTGEVGGWLPRLAANAFTPSKHTQIFHRENTSRQVISIVERGWMRWVLGGGRTLSQAVWQTLTPVSYFGEEKSSPAGDYCTDLMAAEHQTVADLLFITELQIEVPPLDNKASAMVYAVMQFNAIHGARDDLVACIDGWHVAHPKAPQSVTALTIPGKTSAQAAAQAMVLETERIGQLEMVRADYKSLCKRLFASLAMLEPDGTSTTSKIVAVRKLEEEEKKFLEDWDFKGCVYTLACVQVAWERAHTTSLLQVLEGDGFRTWMR